MRHVLTWQQLYDMIRERAVSKVAPELGMSDVALRKIGDFGDHGDGSRIRACAQSGPCTTRAGSDADASEHDFGRAIGAGRCPRGGAIVCKSEQPGDTDRRLRCPARSLRLAAWPQDRDAQGPRIRSRWRAWV